MRRGVYGKDARKMDNLWSISEAVHTVRGHCLIEELFSINIGILLHFPAPPPANTAPYQSQPSYETL